MTDKEIETQVETEQTLRDIYYSPAQFMFENEETGEKYFFKNWEEYTENTGTHWKTIQLKNKNGQSVKCRLGKGKIWRHAMAHKLDGHCSECKSKIFHHPVGLCHSHLLEKIHKNNGEYFFENEKFTYKDHQSGLAYICTDQGIVYSRSVKA